MKPHTSSKLQKHCYEKLCKGAFNKAFDGWEEWTYDILKISALLTTQKNYQKLDEVLAQLRCYDEQLLCMVAVISSLLQYFDIQQKVYQSYIHNNYKIADGTVEQFHAMPSEGHDSEHFYVGDIYFSYPDSTGLGYSTCKKDG